MRLEKIYVKTFQSGPRAGEWRTFDLPEGAVVIDSCIIWVGDDQMMALTYAVPA